MLSSLFYSTLRATALPALARRLRDTGVVLCYHNVVPAGAASAGADSLHMPLPQFRTQMEWLAHHYRVVLLRELVDRVRSGQSLRGLAAITFDDGYTGVFAHALGILRGLGLPATVFVVAEGPDGGGGSYWWDHPNLPTGDDASRHKHWCLDLRGDGRAILGELGLDPAPPAQPAQRPAPWSVLAAAAQSGVELGVHSATHRTLPRLSDDELTRELVWSRETIGKATGTTPDAFAHPYGIWDDRVRTAAENAGYRCACTLEASLVCRGTDPMALPRVNIPARIGEAAFEAWLSGFNPRKGAHSP
jgi:peptidoglycan/xylan/chitin deacetylase (PgdA/CDA1 family)